jgi:hypothetical protein
MLREDQDVDRFGNADQKVEGKQKTPLANEPDTGPNFDEFD